MADSDAELKFAEMERDNLQGAISAVEVAIASSNSNTRVPLENFLLNAKGRVIALEKMIKDFHLEREREAREQLEISHLAAQETALSTKEKETFDGFLKEDFFIKRDFARLDEFYRRTWDRLSEGGKDQMSHRVWEGIRRDEYKFSELPQIVQEKESGRVYQRLTQEEFAREVSGIPAQDQKDFVDAYQGGEQKSASEVLDRRSFRKNLFLVEAPTKGPHLKAEARKEIAKRTESGETAIKAESAPADFSKADFPLDSIALKLDSGVQQASVSPTVISPAGAGERSR